MKTARLEARLTAEQMNLIEQAAKSKGLATADFLLSTALDEARRVVMSKQAVELTMTESIKLGATLIKPALETVKPSDAPFKIYKSNDPESQIDPQ